jgi:hypothetical protein
MRRPRIEVAGSIRRNDHIPRVYLAVLASPVNIEGDYTLTLAADAACDALPNDLRTRTYAATVRPGSTSLSRMTVVRANRSHGANRRIIG